MSSPHPPSSSSSSSSENNSPTQQQQQQPPPPPTTTTTTTTTSTSTSTSPLILYKPPTILSLLRSTSINLILPFINGLMLGFGELFAHEVAFRLGWGGTRVFPASRRYAIGPGIEIHQEEEGHAKRRRLKREGGVVSAEDLTSLE